METWFYDINALQSDGDGWYFQENILSQHDSVKW